jgi:hypothetical protein
MESIQKYEEAPSKLLRNKIIEQLKHNYTLDHIDVDDYERRLEVANHTKSTAELMALVKGLPETPGEEQNKPVSASGSYALNKGNVSSAMPLVAIFSGIDRKGIWSPAKTIPAISIFGGIQLDLSEARLNPGVTSINVIAIFGGADIIVPDGVNVEVSGIGLFGGFDNATSSEPHPSAPTIRITGVALFGGVSVREKKRNR